MTGKSMPEKYKANFVNGIEEIDLIRSGLDDMMIDGFQSVKKEFNDNDKISDFRTVPIGSDDVSNCWGGTKIIGRLLALEFHEFFPN